MTTSNDEQFGVGQSAGTDGSGAARSGQDRSRGILFVVLFALTIGITLAARYAAEATEIAGGGGSAGGGAAVAAGGELHRQLADPLVSLEGRLDRGAVHVGSDGLVHLELIAKGAKLDEGLAVRRPTDLVVVLDRSGSMGGDPMQKALAAVRELISQLGEDDRFGLVTYSNGAELFLPLTKASASARASWVASLSEISAGGGTNMSVGLDRAHALVTSDAMPGRVTRVLLLSDGHANQGDATPEGLSKRSGRAVTGEYVLSAVGVGDGFDERLMARLADAGTGNFYYVPEIEVLGGIFSAEFDSARETVASALEFQIDTPPGVEVVDAAGYPLEAHSDRVLIRPGTLFGGQQRSFWVTLKVPASQAGLTELGNVTLRYSTPDGEREQMELASFPAIKAVIDENDFVASLDKEAVQTHYLEERVNRVRQSVSKLVATGAYGEAQTELDSVDFSELKALGYDLEETESFEAIQDLKKDVGRAAAAPAADQSRVQNKLGKSLYESGTDGRRKGAKR